MALKLVRETRNRPPDREEHTLLLASEDRSPADPLSRGEEPVVCYRVKADRLAAIIAADEAVDKAEKRLVAEMKAGKNREELTWVEIAEALGKHPATIRNWVARIDIPRQRRYPRQHTDNCPLC